MDKNSLAYQSDRSYGNSMRAAIEPIAAQEVTPKDVLSPVFKELSEAFSPATLVFSSQLEVLYSIGDCERYTRKMAPGPSSLKVDAILDQSLVVAVTTAMQKAKREQQAVTYLGVALPDDTVVDLSVRFTRDAIAAEEYLLVSFITSDDVKQDHAPVQFDEKQMMVSRIEDLEFELQQSRANLAVTVEELETSNEELQSINEELMAANEELQSTNEELQSVNEELFSVNSEYQHKVMLLEEATSDFENLLKNPSVSLIAVDRDLTVKHFSPSVTSYFKLRSSDLERSIEDISHDLGERFAIDCKKVLETEQELTTEYRTSAKELLLARFTPYIDIHDEVNGLVISFADVGDSQLIKREKDSFIRARAVLDRQHDQLAKTLNPLRTSEEPADLRILIVEDDPDDASLLIKLLNKSSLFNLRFDQSRSIGTAREIFNAGNFDLVILDYALEGENSREAIETEVFDDVPVILLSGLPQNELTDFEAPGVYDFVEKSTLSTSVLEKSLHLTLQSYHVDQFLKLNEIS